MNARHAIKKRNMVMEFTINHILINTKDMAAMIRFFEQSLGLENGKRPPFAFTGAWLWSKDTPIIHLVDTNPADQGDTSYLKSKKSVEGCGTGIIDHIAFSGQDYSSLKARLKRHQLKYFERTVPLTREHQLFVDGPEGLRIEVQFKMDEVPEMG